MVAVAVHCKLVSGPRFGTRNGPGLPLWNAFRHGIALGSDLGQLVWPVHDDDVRRAVLFPVSERRGGSTKRE